MKNWDQLQAAASLYEESMRQQQRNSEVLAELNQSAARHEAAMARFQTVCEQLPSHVARQINAVLPGAAKSAASEISAKWTSANEHADRAADAYERAARFAPLRVMGLALACVALGAGSMIFIGYRVLPDGATNTALRIEEGRLAKNIELMRAHGGDAALRYCEDHNKRQRLCIQVDEAAKVQPKGYRVIRGY
jgi:hypothetical protein